MRRPVDLALIFIFCVLLASCGSGGNSGGPAAGDVHPAGWLLAHDERAREDLLGCQICHGINFEGPGSVPSCFQCHFGSGPPFLKHPPKQVERLPWGNPVNHGYYAERVLFQCQGCHAQQTASGIPRFNRSYPGMEQGCESTEGCHFVSNEPVSDPAFREFNNGHNFRVAHPSFDPDDPLKQDPLHWYGTLIPYTDDQGVERSYPITHIGVENVQQSCTPCHGANLQGVAVDGVQIPGCQNCHVRSPLEQPSDCASCHGPRPVGNVPLDTLDPEFIRELPTTQHMQIPHPFLSAAQKAAGCDLCHISSAESDELPPDDPTRIDNRHHTFVFEGRIIPEGTAAPYGTPGQVYQCDTCHRITFENGNVVFKPDVTNCLNCHAQP